jgi:AraC-like DNA-binding protein
MLIDMTQVVSRQRTARARITMSGARAAYIGPALALAPHRNVVTTVAIALQAPFRLQFLNGPLPVSEPLLCRVALIPSGMRHHLSASGEMIFLYLDALSDDSAQLRTLDLVTAHARLMHEAGEVVRASKVDALCAALGVPARTERDTRIADVVRRIDHCPQAFGSVGAAALEAGMSTSRFQVLFRQAVGVPFRRYRLWRRMAVVMQALSARESLTTAAFDAGFSSSAHLSAAFKDMFGLTPSDVVALAPSFDFTPTERQQSCGAVPGSGRWA